MGRYFTEKKNPKGGFVKFSNADGKVWIMPVVHLALAMGIYQPSAFKGKLIKLFLPYFYWFPKLNWLIDIEFVDVVIDKDVECSIKNVLGIGSFFFSIYEGTPSVHKKMTMQIWQEKQILAYCKLSNSVDVKEILFNEREMLNSLNDKGLGDNIPTCFYCDKIKVGGDDIIFIESTIKSVNSKIVNSFSDEHLDFLVSLHKNTKVKIDYNRSDLAKSIDYLESQLFRFSSSEKECIVSNLERVRFFYSASKCEFSLYHGDFTPWNMFLTNEKLFVFDFEYAGATYPPFLDWFHFFTQTAICVNKMNADEIVKQFAKSNVQIKRYCGDVNFLYSVYILDIISKYLKREKGELSIETESLMDIWLRILFLL